MQRLRFAAKLLAAAGYPGWVVLFDEVELIGRYSLQQRAKSYAELARWVRGEHGAPGLPIAAVLAMTDDFEAAVLSDKNDRELVPARVRAKETSEAGELAARAETGMRIIEADMTLLTPPDAAELDAAYARLKELHGVAFGWAPPDVPGLERLGATRMRQYVRAWINEWDLVRLDPDAAASTASAASAATLLQARVGSDELVAVRHVLPVAEHLAGGGERVHDRRIELPPASRACHLDGGLHTLRPVIDLDDVGHVPQPHRQCDLLATDTGRHTVPVPPGEELTQRDNHLRPQTELRGHRRGRGAVRMRSPYDALTTGHAQRRGCQPVTETGRRARPCCG